MLMIHRTRYRQVDFVSSPKLLLDDTRLLHSAFVVQGFSYRSITLAKAELHRTSEAINGLSAATDVVIAAIFTWLLFQTKTSFIRTNTLINKLIVRYVRLYPEAFLTVTFARATRSTQAPSPLSAQSSPLYVQ